MLQWLSSNSLKIIRVYKDEEKREPKYTIGTSLVAQTVKCVCLQCRKPRFDPWVGKILWGRKWQSTPVLLPRKSHGQSSVVGYSPWGRKESDTTV